MDSILSRLMFAAAYKLIFPALAVTWSLQADQPLPANYYAALPYFAGAELSPSGDAIAHFVPHKGKNAVLYQNMDGSDRGLIPAPDDMVVDAFYWANDDVLLVKLGALMDRRVFRGKSYNTRVYSFHRQTQKFVWLGQPETQFKSVPNKQVQISSQFERIVDFLPNDPNRILMQMDFDLDGFPEVFRVDVTNGRRKKIRRQKRGVQDWYTDTQSEIRLGVGYDKSKWFGTYKAPNGNWKNLKNVDWADRANIEGFSEDPNNIYVSGLSEHGRRAIYLLDVTTGKVVKEIFSHPDYDAAGIVAHPLTGYPAGVRFIDDYSRIKYFDKDLDRMQRSFNKAMPTAVNTIIDMAKDKPYYLLYSHNDQMPGDYYLYDRESKNLHFIATSQAGIDIEKSAVTQPVSITVRDGTTIWAYLTRPKGTEGQALPTVILPHGGPEARDTAAWGYMSQFYASRGYQVLKPNFRGSTGYGQAFRLAGRHQWGGLMQRDVTDATRWLINEKLADPDRICIAGISYGGYAALMGLAQEPDLYRCAISINGVTNLPGLKNHDQGYIGGRSWTKTMGLEGEDDDTVSPHHLVNSITKPVLFVAAKDDERIPFRLTRATHRRFEKRGKDSTYIELDDGGHSIETSEARLKMLLATEAFLQKHQGTP